MDNQKLGAVLGFFAWMLLAIIMCIDVHFKDIKIKNLKQQAINLGYAEYNSTNSNWQWKTNLAERK